MVDWILSHGQQTLLPSAIIALSLIQNEIFIYTYNETAFTPFSLIYIFLKLILMFSYVIVRKFRSGTLKLVSVTRSPGKR